MVRKRRTTKSVSQSEEELKRTDEKEGRKKLDFIRQMGLGSWVASLPTHGSLCWIESKLFNRNWSIWGSTVGSWVPFLWWRALNFNACEKHPLPREGWFPLSSWMDSGTSCDANSFHVWCDWCMAEFDEMAKQLFLTTPSQWMVIMFLWILYPNNVRFYYLILIFDSYACLCFFFFIVPLIAQAPVQQQLQGESFVVECSIFLSYIASLILSLAILNIILLREFPSVISSFPSLFIFIHLIVMCLLWHCRMT